MATKRVILANSSRLLQEMLQRVINKADNLEVVQAIPHHEELPAAIERLGPEWVIVSLPSNSGRNGWIDTYTERYPSVRFIVLSPGNRIKMKWQTAFEEDLSGLSLREFIQVLEKDLQHT